MLDRASRNPDLGVLILVVLMLGRPELSGVICREVTVSFCEMLDRDKKQHRSRTLKTFMG